MKAAAEYKARAGATNNHETTAEDLLNAIDLLHQGLGEHGAELQARRYDMAVAVVHAAHNYQTHVLDLQATTSPEIRKALFDQIFDACDRFKEHTAREDGAVWHNKPASVTNGGEPKRISEPRQYIAAAVDELGGFYAETASATTEHASND